MEDKIRKTIIECENVFKILNGFYLIYKFEQKSMINTSNYYNDS